MGLLSKAGLHGRIRLPGPVSWYEVGLGRWDSVEAWWKVLFYVGYIGFGGLGSDEHKL